MLILVLLAAGCGASGGTGEPGPAEAAGGDGGEAGSAGADLAAAAAALREKAPEGFPVVIEPPFVVAGNLPEATLRRIAAGTIRWAVGLLRKQYFPRDPGETIEVWLFGDDGSYREGARKIFGDEPTTPYGYYSSEHRALIMNIATGGGTLVHEIVHPYIRANFPGCPPWFNEGLASLYEQSAEREGRIVGLPNWRLPALKEAIRGEKTVPFEELFGMSEGTFYGEGSGLHYAQARYLCYYLQEKGLLEEFFRTFTGAGKDDPAGTRSLRDVLGVEALEPFRKRWEAWVLAIEYET